MRKLLRPLVTAAAVATLTVVPVTTLAARQLRSQALPHAVPASDWTTYHHDQLRTADGRIHGGYNVLHAKVHWNLPMRTAAERNDIIYGSPLIVGRTAFVTTLENKVYAISLATGRTMWERTLGPAYSPPSSFHGIGTCGDVGPNVGIVGTPVIDEGRGELFVVDTDGLGAGGEARAPALRTLDQDRQGAARP